jgi:hypothetical protein
MDETKVTLRFPTELHAALVEWAKEEERSLNAQIVYLLREDVALRPDPDAIVRFDRKAMRFVLRGRPEWTIPSDEELAAELDRLEKFLAERDGAEQDSSSEGE